MKLNRSTYEILQILSASLFDKTHLKELLQALSVTMSKSRNANNWNSI